MKSGARMGIQNKETAKGYGDAPGMRHKPSEAAP
jgi:hypothetical protein